MASRPFRSRLIGTSGTNNVLNGPDARKKNGNFGIFVNMEGSLSLEDQKNLS